MLLDLLSNSNIVSYNTKIAQIIGLHQAIYLSELLAINEKAIRKEKTNESFFTLDREYITKRTTFDVKEQLEIEKRLIDLGILAKVDGDKNSLKLDVEKLTAIFMSEDEKLLKKVTVVASKKPRMSKDDAIIAQLQQAVVCSNAELKKAYYDWITSAYAKNGFMSRVAVEQAQNDIDGFSQCNLDVALNVLRIAAINGYRDIQWAIDRYKKDGGEIPKPYKRERKINFGDEVF